jgi:hypothetical protein
MKRGRAYKEIKQTSNDIEEQNVFTSVREKRSLIFYCEMKVIWTREEYVMCCISRQKWDSIF